MYNILIVDDEKKERDGITRLIRRYGFQLKVSQASNGEEALEEFEKHPFDILLTDIKMPFMDGIELIKEVQKRGYNPICVIYSAYGEFEYAQNAISLGVREYLLKPIRLDAFDELFHKVIDLCRAKDEVEQEKEKVKEAYEEVAAYRLGWKMLNYLESVVKDTGADLEKDIDFESNYCIPVLISCYTNLFSAEWESYQKEIEKLFGRESLIINKEDNQILVVLMPGRQRLNMKEIKDECSALIEQSKRKFHTDVFIVIGSAAENPKELKAEYEKIKDQLDYQFFVSDSMMIINDESYYAKKEKDMLALYFERIFNCPKMRDYRGAKKELEKVFSYIERQTGFSSIYVKYTFSDAIKRIAEYTKADIDILVYIEKIYEARSFDEVRLIVEKALDDMAENRREDEKENRLVHMAKELIYEKYGESLLSVSYIAEELSVSTAYLSSLFKIETGENLVKFITRYRIEKSKELLRQSNMKVSDIAGKVGYINVSYYTSIFRNQVGLSPLQYREKADETE